DFLPLAAAGLAACGTPASPTSRRRRPAAPAPAPELAPVAIRPSDERGYADHGWLQARHSFSFARYRDPRFMGYRGLRVLNEDRIAPEQGFPLHPHRDMEIVTYLLEGALEHRDTLGSGGVIRPGRAQRMSAGSGIRHSEFAKSELTHLLQIWIRPSERGIRPSYEDQPLPRADMRGQLLPIAGPPGSPGAVTIHTDARIHVARLGPGHRVEHVVAPGRGAWVQLARGRVRLNGQRLLAGDGAFTTAPGRLAFDEADEAELLLFDLA
ncbi:MAG TPA: pirin family protein, partial [Polyangiaceae bacterium LLY-WYZ-15_(1-7)]|nr:pirin family protein [Polyangiaceae bacterium LLY-WYZ-15_(1-7)]